MIREIFKMLNQYAVDNPTLPVDQCPSHFIRYLKGCWAILWECRAAMKGRQAFGTHMVHRETFLQIHLHLHQLLILKNCINGIRRSRSRSIRPQWRKVKGKTRSRSEMPVWTVSQRFSHLQWRRLFKELWGRPTTSADFWSPLWQVSYTSNLCLLEDKVQDRGMYLFTISYGGDAIDQRSGDGWFIGWIKIFVIYTWYFNAEFLKYLMQGLLQHWTKSSIILRRISLEAQKVQKQDRFLRGRQIAYLIYEYFWVTGANDSLENYADLFTISLRNDDIQEFDSKWDGIILSMTKIPPDDTLEGLYKLRIRESEKLKTALELYDLEIHQKKLGPDYHRLKTMVKRSIEQ